MRRNGPAHLAQHFLDGEGVDKDGKPTRPPYSDELKAAFEVEVTTTADNADGGKGVKKMATWTLTASPQ